MSVLASIADNWSSIYSHSWALRSCVNFAHIGALVGSGGCAIAADRATLIAFGRDRHDRARHTDTFAGLHKIVVGGLAIVAISGLLLLFADLDGYLHASVFWVKMAAVAALIVNGGLLVRAGERAGRGDERAWSALRFTSIASLVLWFGTT